MDIPERVKVEVRVKQIKVTSTRGTLTKNFKHLNVDYQLMEGNRKLKVDACFGSKKTITKAKVLHQYHVPCAPRVQHG